MVDLDGPVSPLILGLKLALDTNSFWPYVLLFIILIVGAFFSGSETAFSYCNKYRLDVNADDGSKTSKLVLNILDHFDSLIVTILIGTNVTHILMSVIATILATYLFGAYGSLISTIVITLIVFFFGEMLPKSIAKYNADSWAKVAAYPIKGLMILLWPISKFFEGIIFIARKIFKYDESNDEESFTEDDFTDVIEKVEEEGGISEDESDIIQNAVEFGDIKVKDILTTRSNMVALDINKCTPKSLNAFLLENEYSRIPIYENNIDNIIGILHVRTYLRAYFKNNKIKISSILKPAYIVSSQETIDNIFEGFKKNKTHIAIIKSSKGKTLGMVTMKDILEELVGDIDEGKEALEAIADEHKDLVLNPEAHKQEVK